MSSRSTIKVTVKLFALTTFFYSADGQVSLFLAVSAETRLPAEAQPGGGIGGGPPHPRILKKIMVGCISLRGNEREEEDESDILQ